MLQPDIVVVCDPTILQTNRITGAPDLVIEILSPSTDRRDRSIKYQLYEEAGVREYWIVDPVERSVQVFLLEDGQFVPKEKAGPEDHLPVIVLDGCVIDLARVFK